MEIDELTDTQRAVLVAFSRQGGRGNRNDIRKAAGVSRGYGNPIVDGLLDRGLLRKPSRDDYWLTEEGVQLAERLIERGH